MDVTNLTSGLLGALVGAVIGSAASIVLQTWKERRESRAKTYANLYSMWFELILIRSGFVFREEVGDDVGRELESPYEERQFAAACQDIFAEMRKMDDIPEGEAMLRAMYADYAFESERHRLTAMDEIGDALGQRTSPRLTRIRRAIRGEMPPNWSRKSLRDFAKRYAKFREKLIRGNDGSTL